MGRRGREGPRLVSEAGTFRLDADADAATPRATGAAQALGRAPSRRDATFRRLLAAADVCAVLGALEVVVALNGDDLRLSSLVFAAAFVFVAKATGLYDRDQQLLNKTTLEEVPALFALAAVTCLAAVLADRLLVAGGLERVQVLELCGLLSMLLIALRALARKVAGQLEPEERCLFLGASADAAFLRHQLDMASSSVAASLVAVLPPLTVSPGPHGRLELPDEVGDAIVEERIDRVIVANLPPQAGDGLPQVLRRLGAYGVKVSVLPQDLPLAGTAVQLDQLPSVTLLGIRGLEVSRSSQFVKRAFDVVGSVLGLIVLAPILMLIACLIKLDSPGAVIYRQRRVGRQGPPERGWSRPVQGARRPTCDPRRRLPSPLFARRAPAAVECAAGTDEPGGPPSADSVGGRTDRGVVPTPPRGPAGNDRALADPLRLAEDRARGDGEAGLPVRGQLDTVERRQAPPANRPVRRRTAGVVRGSVRPSAQLKRSKAPQAGFAFRLCFLSPKSRHVLHLAWEREPGSRQLYHRSRVTPNRFARPPM